MKTGMLAALILIKSIIITQLLFKTGISPLLLWSCAGIVFIFTFIIAVIYSGKVKATVFDKKEYFLVLIFLILLLIFSGCGQTKFPEVDSETKLDYIPSKILCTGDNIFIGEENGNKVHILNAKNLAEKEQFETGYKVYDIVSNGKFIYSANKLSNSITVYNTETKQKTDIKSVGAGPVAMAIYPERKKLYVANITGSNVAIIDLNSLTVESRISTGKWPSYLYLASDKKYLYVTCQYTNTIEIIDTEKERNVLVTIPVGISPVSIIPIDEKNLAIIHEWEYAFNNQSNIVILDRKKYSVVKSILTDGGVSGGELSKSKKYLYLTVPAKDKIIFIDIRKGEKVFEIQLKDDFPKWLEISPNGKLLYVAAQHSKKIIVIRTNGLI